MRRRDLLIGISILSGIPVEAQDAPKRRIGLLGNATPEQWTARSDVGTSPSGRSSACGFRPSTRGSTASRPSIAVSG